VVLQAELKGPLLPFKGKGGARGRLHELEERQTALEHQMRALAASFTVTLRAPRPASLVVHHYGGYYHLRWRAAGGRQTFFEFCTSGHGQQLLTSVPDPARALLLQFERQRLALNLASSTCQHELRRMRDYLTKLEALQAWEAGNPV
jgi:hypothetical protein